MQFDPLNDALIKIYNAEQAGARDVLVSPASKLLGSVLTIMQKSGYVGEFDRVEDGRGGSYSIKLSGSINRCGVVKPRYSIGRKDFEKFESRYLPAQDFGLLIISTNKGVMNHQEAKDSRIGGRLIAYIY